MKTKIIYIVNIKTREIKLFDSPVAVRLFIKEQEKLDNKWRVIEVD